MGGWANKCILPINNSRCSSTTSEIPNYSKDTIELVIANAPQQHYREAREEWPETHTLFFSSSSLKKTKYAGMMEHSVPSCGINVGKRSN